jgi:chromosome segregation ATPase
VLDNVQGVAPVPRPRRSGASHQTSNVAKEGEAKPNDYNLGLVFDAVNCLTATIEKLNITIRDQARHLQTIQEEIGEQNRRLRTLQGTTERIRSQLEASTSSRPAVLGRSFEQAPERLESRSSGPVGRERSPERVERDRVFRHPRCAPRY